MEEMPDLAERSRVLEQAKVAVESARSLLAQLDLLEQLWSHETPFQGPF